MMFALSDYIQWRLRRGRYGDQQSSWMRLAFKGTPPREIIDQLLPGDFFVTQRLDRWFSWAMMHFSSSAVDHCGIYMRDGLIAHQTFQGACQDPLRFVAKGTRILFLRPYDFGEFARNVERRRSRLRYFHSWPPKLQLTLGAIEIVLGFYPERFRWRFLADLALIAGLFDLALYKVESFPIFLSVVGLLSGIALANKARWAIRRWLGLTPPVPMNCPDAVLKLSSSSLVFTNLGPLVAGPFGLLPLLAVKLIAADSTAPESDQEPSDWGQFFRGILDQVEVSIEDEGPAES